jgi:hypothetical protein
VEKMRASAYNFQPYHANRELPDLWDFEVPPEHFAPILAALAPSRKAPQVFLWQVKGKLHITCRDGRSYDIHLYWTGVDEGAFKIGPPGRVGTYCIGGSDQGIDDAIRAAFRRK